MRSLGFTLIELVVVVLVLGILAAVFVPRTNQEVMILSTQAEQFAADIRYVQALAMSQGWSGTSTTARRPYSVNFTATTYRFVDGYGISVVHPSGTTNPIAFADGVNVSSLGTAPLSNNLVSFNGLGKPYADFSAVSSPLAATATITLSRSGGATTRTIQIYPETGMVRLP